MANHKQFKLLKLFCVCSFLSWLVLSGSKSQAAQNWENVDQQVQNKIFQLNVGLKMKLRKTFWVQTTGLSTKQHYYLFTTSVNDRGYQVVGRGSSFQVFNSDKRKMFVLTSNHILDNAKQIKEECEMFYAAVALYAKRSAAKHNQRFDQLLSILNLISKKECSKTEKELCQKTVNDIWDCYDTYLSKRADPHRILFNQYKRQVPIDMQASYFLHSPGPLLQKAIEARVYRRAKSTQPDLAILEAVLPAKAGNNKGLSLDMRTVAKGTEIQVIGYPVLPDQKISTQQYLRPTYSTGKITKTMPQMFQFAASVTKGNSGGPVINHDGKVLGVVTTRGMTSEGHISPNCGGAVNIQALKSFAPELFK